MSLPTADAGGRYQSISTVRRTDTVENDFFGFPKVKWLHLTGEVDKSVRFPYEIFSVFNEPKITSRLIFDRVIQKTKMWGHSVDAHR